MRAVLALLLWTVLLVPTRASAEGDLLPTIQSIVERGTLVIAVIDESRPPMIIHGQDGKLSGFDVELGNDIAQALGVKSKFVPVGPGTDDIVEAVASGQADIGLSYMSESVEAAKKVFLSQPYMIEAQTAFINRTQATQFGGACPRVSDLVRLAQTAGSVGVMDRVAYVRLVEEAAPGVTTEPFRDMESLAAAVEAGDLVASLQGELSAKYYLSRQPQASIRLQLCDVPDTQHRVSAAVRPDGIDFLRWLDIYISQRGVIIDLDTLLYRADGVVY